MKVKRVLMVAANFPPVGGVGVLRAVKTAKYLPQAGYEVFVLTASGQTHVQRDEALLDEVGHAGIIRVPDPNPYRWLLRARMRGSAGTGVAGSGASRNDGRLRIVRRAGRMVLRNTAVPDPFVWWARKARAEGRRAIAEHRIDVVWSTCQPPSAHLLAYWLQGDTGIPWVADYRDPWTWSLMNPVPRHLLGLEERMERRLLGRAAAVVTVTEGWAEEFRRRYGSLVSRVEVIYNGFDPEDVVAGAPGEPGRFTVSFAGSLHHRRSPEAFLRGLALALESIPRDRIRVVFIGRFDAPGEGANRGLVEALGLADVVEVVGPVGHAAAMERLGAADLLLDIGIQGEGSEGHVPAKLVEYAGLGKPVLALHGPGEAYDLVLRAGLGRAVDPDDGGAVAEALLDLYREWEAGRLVGPPAEARNLFDRRHQAMRLGELLDEATSARS